MARHDIDPRQLSSPRVGRCGSEWTRLLLGLFALWRLNLRRFRGLWWTARAARCFNRPSLIATRRTNGLKRTLVRASAIFFRLRRRAFFWLLDRLSLSRVMRASQDRISHILRGIWLLLRL